MPCAVFLMVLLNYCHANNQKINNFLNDEEIRIQSYLKPTKEFCTRHNYNSDIFFLIDMRVHSGKKRFFIIDLNRDSVINSGLVAHGVCGLFFSATAGFSNKPNYGCSSLGKYKIGNKYSGRFGTSYKLFGLDSSNSNAYKRSVVLHSYYEIPDNEIYPAHVCNSLGCPMVSKIFFKTLSHVIDNSKKPVLLWIIN